jgi:hypothetical protein
VTLDTNSFLKKNRKKNSQSFVLEFLQRHQQSSNSKYNSHNSNNNNNNNNSGKIKITEKMIGDEIKYIFCPASYMHLQIMIQTHHEVLSAAAVLFLVIVWFTGIVLYAILFFHEFFVQEDPDEIEASLDKFLITRISYQLGKSNDCQMSETCAICLGGFGKSCQFTHRQYGHEIATRN